MLAIAMTIALGALIVAAAIAVALAAVMCVAFLCRLGRNLGREGVAL